MTQAETASAAEIPAHSHHFPSTSAPFSAQMLARHNEGDEFPDAAGHGWFWVDGDC